MQNVRQYLRNYSKTKEGKEKLLKLFEFAKNENYIIDYDFWLLNYAYIKCKMVDNTCMKLGISKALYHNHLNIALAKIETVIKKLDKIYTL